MQCSNPDCAKPLTGGVDTFGPVDMPVCITCWFEYVAKLRLEAKMSEEFVAGLRELNLLVLKPAKE